MAAQTVSQSVADALKFLKKYDKFFEEADATIEFIQKFDLLFDIMNCRNMYGKGYKSPLTLQNRDMWEEVLVQSRNYICNLKCDTINLLYHKRKTFALGFSINTYSFQHLVND